MIATHIVRYSVILVFPQWLRQTLFAGVSFGESAPDQPVTSSNQWGYVDGVLAMSNLSRLPLMSFTLSGRPAPCSCVEELFSKKVVDSSMGNGYI